MKATKLFLYLAVVLFASYAYAADKMPSGVQARKTDSGMTVLADAKGMTLYTFDRT
jgi:predicted lipoprotein with Yx(FWY)xxD motif